MAAVLSWVIFGKPWQVRPFGNIDTQKINNPGRPVKEGYCKKTFMVAKRVTTAVAYGI